jgi:hypothetical protein
MDITTFYSLNISAFSDNSHDYDFITTTDF